jgi:hypothetical protein
MSFENKLTPDTTHIKPQAIDGGEVEEVDIHVRSQETTPGTPPKQAEDLSSSKQWREVAKDEILPPGSEIRMNFSDGKNYVLEGGEQKQDVQPDTPEKVAEEPMSPEVAAHAEKLKSALNTQAENIEQEGRARKLWDTIERISDGYNKIPFKYKIAIAAGLGVASVAASGAVAAGIAGAMIAQRVAGGAATAIAIEGLLARSVEKDGTERTQKQVLFHRTLGVVAGMTVGSGQVAEGVSYAADKFSDGFSFLTEYLTEHANTQYANVPDDIMYSETTPAYVTPSATLDSTIDTPSTDSLSINETTESVGVAPPAQLPETPVIEHMPEGITYTVPEGGNVWSGIENELDSRGLLEGLDTETRTQFIDAIENKVTNLSPQELKDIGISSGNPHLVYPGEEIDLTALLSPESVEYQEVVDTYAPPAENDALEASQQLTEDSATASTSATEDVYVETNVPAEENMSMHPTFEALNHDLNELYGHLGVGRTLANPVHGAESVHWIGPHGLSFEHVGDLMKTNPDSLDIAGSGTESSEAVRVTQAHLKDLVERSGASFKADETVREYMTRAHNALLSGE